LTRCLTLRVNTIRLMELAGLSFDFEDQHCVIRQLHDKVRLVMADRVLIVVVDLEAELAHVRRYPDADTGLIVSTASNASESFEKALDKFREDTGKQVALLIGPEVAAFFLRFGG